MSVLPDPHARAAVVVTGMHRTGSSAMTRVLSLAGVALPARLLDPSPGNPTGHWEPLEVMRLNDAMLAAQGSDWCDPRAFGLNGGGVLANPYWLDRAKRVLLEDYALAPRIVIKDPRTSLLMRFWPRALAQTGLETRVVIMVRGPRSVARSLARRDAFPLSQSVLLWMSYMLAAERDTRALPRVFVAYDDLLEDWRRALARVNTGLGLDLAECAAAQAPAIEAFLDRELRHFDVSTAGDAPIWSAAARAGAAFDAAARGDTPDLAAFDAARGELEAVLGVVEGALVNLRGDRERLQRRVAALGG